MGEKSPALFPIIADLVTSVGLVVTIVLFLSDRTPAVVGTMLSIMFVVGCLTVWRIGSLLAFPFRAGVLWKPSNSRTAVGMFLCLLWGSSVVWYGYQKWPSGIHVEPKFMDAYQHFGQRLGNPINNAFPLSVTDEERLQVATALWEPHSFDYVLWDGTKRWEYLGESTPPPRDKWHDPEWTREQLHIEGGGPPVGDLAYAWGQNPEYWKRMGLVQWKCTGKNTTYQDFEHGRLIGILRGTLYNDSGIIFALFDDYQWESVKVTSGTVQFDSAATSDCKYWDPEQVAYVPVK